MLIYAPYNGVSLTMGDPQHAKRNINFCLSVKQNVCKRNILHFSLTAQLQQNLNLISNLLAKFICFFTNWSHFCSGSQEFPYNVIRLNVCNALFALNISFGFVGNILLKFQKRLIYFGINIETRISIYSFSEILQ